MIIVYKSYKYILQQETLYNRDIKVKKRKEKKEDKIRLKDEIEGKKTSLLAQMYDRNRILVMLPIMWLNIS